MRTRNLALVGLVALLAACGGSDGGGDSGGGGGGGDGDGGGGGTTALLALSVDGAGAVEVTGGGVSVHCQGQCTATVPAGVPLVAIARPDVGAVFEGWGGACTGAGDCTLTANGTVALTATFVPAPPPPPGESALSVERIGEGTGRVTSAPAGIDCGATCRADFVEGTTVTLGATPAEGSRFEGWGGACSGTGACVVTLGADDVTVTARFEPVAPPRSTLTVSRAGDGSGVVRSDPAGIDCGPDCSEAFDAGTEVTLGADPDDGSTFQGWSGAGCTGTGACTLTLGASAAVTATFVKAPPPPPKHTVTVKRAGEGGGAVKSAPAGIDCGADCSEAFQEGTAVTLTATPAEGSTFEGWSGGGCAGTASCVVTLGADDVTVTARFALEEPPPPPPERTITVNRAGEGGGAVKSEPAGIDCGADCSEAFQEGTAVTLTATPAEGSTFEGWSGGGCAGTDPCELTLADDDVAVTATFTVAEPPPPKPFVLEELEPPDPDGAVSVAAINAGGDVVGAYTRGDGESRAFVRRAGETSLTLIGPEGEATAARGVNDDGAVAVADVGARTSARWVDGVLTPLEIDVANEPLGISPSGAIVGRTFMDDGDTKAFVAEDVEETLLDPPSGTDHCLAKAMNASGVVVGGCLSRAVRWDAAGSPAALDVPEVASANDVTDGGLVCGTAEERGDHSDGFLLDLGTGVVTPVEPDATDLKIRLEAMNEDGVAVGSVARPDGTRDAVIFQAGEFARLADLVDDPGWRLESAVDVNAAGEILVNGRGADERGRSAVVRPRAAPSVSRYAPPFPSAQSFSSSWYDFGNSAWYRR